MNEHKGSEFHAVSELNSYISKLYDGPYLKLYDAQLAFNTSTARKRNCEQFSPFASSSFQLSLENTDRD